MTRRAPLQSILSALAPAFILAIALAAGAAQALDGGYRGLDAAEGMKLEFAKGADDRFTGVLTERDGARIPFDADSLTTGAETVIQRGGRPTYMLFTEEPLGLSVVIIPMTDAQELITNETEALVFLDDAVETPKRPARYLPPPSGPGANMDPRSFVESYAFWPPQAVGYGFGMVRGRYQTLIRLHPVVQADILWKMCRAPSEPASLGDALRGQGVTCDDVLSALGAMMRPGGGGVEAFNAFRDDVEAQKTALIEAIRCSIDFRRNDPNCKRAGARVAKAAVSLVTVKTVLDRY